MFKKILKVLLFLSMNWLESNPCQNQLKVNVRKDTDLSKVEIFYRDESINHIIGADISEFVHQNFNLVNNGLYEIYSFGDVPIFQIKIVRPVVELLCSIRDLDLELNSDFSVDLASLGSKNVLNKLKIVSFGAIKNRGEIFVNESFVVQCCGESFHNFDNETGKICCLSSFNLNVVGSFKNKCGSIFAKSLNISAYRILNVDGTLCANGHFVFDKRSFNTLVQVGGLCLDANIINNACGLIYGSIGETWMFNELSNSSTGSMANLDNSYGKILGDDIKIEAKHCTLDFGLIESKSNLMLNVNDISSNDEFTLIANESVKLQAKSAKCHPKIYSKKLLIKLESIVTHFIFDKKTDIQCCMITILGESAYFHKIAFSGQITSKLFVMKECKLIGDVKFNIECLDLSDKESSIQLSTFQHEIKEIHAKSDEMKFIEGAKLPKAFIYLKSDTSAVYCDSKFPCDLTLIQQSDEQVDDLHIYGDVVLNDLKIKTTRSIATDFYSVPLLGKLDSFVVEASGLLLKNCDIKTVNLNAITTETPVQLYGGLREVKEISIQGAGLIINQALSFDVIKANCNIFGVCKDINGKVDVKTNNVILAACEDNGDEKFDLKTFANSINKSNKRVNIKLKEDSIIKTVNGTAKNVDIQSQGALNIDIAGEFKIIPGYVEEENKCSVIPSKFHSKDLLTLHVGSEGKVENYAGDFHSDKKIYQHIEDGGSVKHLCAKQIVQTVDEKKRDDLSFKDKCILESGGHYFNVLTETPISAKLLAPEIKFFGGDVTLENTDINGNLTGDVKSLTEVEFLKTVKKEGQILEGKFFYSELKSVNSEEGIVVKCDQSKTKNIKAKNRNYKKKKVFYNKTQEIVSRQLTQKSQTLISISCILCMNYFGIAATSSSTFVKYSIDGFIDNLFSRCVTSGISYGIDDKNWKNEIISERAVVDLVVGSLIQGCIGSLFKGELSRQKGTRTGIDNHFDSVKDLFKHPKEFIGLLLTQCAGDLGLSYLMGDIKTSEDFVKELRQSVWKHAVASCSKCLTNHIGKKYSNKELSYLQHKGVHFVAGAGYQVVKLAPALYFNKDKDMWFKLGAAALGGGLGASISEMVAEHYYIVGKNNYLSSLKNSNDGEVFVLSEEQQGIDFYKLQLLQNKAAFIGKFSTMAVGLCLGNVYSLNAAYESGFRTIEHNYLNQPIVKDVESVDDIEIILEKAKVAVATSDGMLVVTQEGDLYFINNEILNDKLILEQEQRDDELVLKVEEEFQKEQAEIEDYTYGRGICCFVKSFLIDGSVSLSYAAVRPCLQGVFTAVGGVVGAYFFANPVGGAAVGSYVFIGVETGVGAVLTFVYVRNAKEHWQVWWSCSGNKEAINEAQDFFFGSLGGILGGIAGAKIGNRINAKIANKIFPKNNVDYKGFTAEKCNNVDIYYKNHIKNHPDKLQYIKNNKHIKFEPGDRVVNIEINDKNLFRETNLERVCPKKHWASSSKAYAEKMAKSLHEKYNLKYKVIEFEKKLTPKGHVFTYVIEQDGKDFSVTYRPEVKSSCGKKIDKIPCAKVQIQDNIAKTKEKFTFLERKDLTK